MDLNVWITSLELKTPEQWLKEPMFKGVEVLDPDGWDRKGDFESDWNKPINEAEMWQKLFVSTCSWPAALFNLKALEEENTQRLWDAMALLDCG